MIPTLRRCRWRWALDNLDSTQAAEPDGKRWKRDDVSKDMLRTFAEEAARTATKEMASLMLKDAEERETRFVVNNRCTMEHLDGMVKGISESLEGRMSEFENRLQTRWTVFERKWEENIIEPDAKEGVISNAKHRIRRRVCKVRRRKSGRIAWKARTRSQRTKLRR